MRIIHARQTSSVEGDSGECHDGVIVLVADDNVSAADVIENYVGPSKYWAVQSETLMVLADPEVALPSDLLTDVPLVPHK